MKRIMIIACMAIFGMAAPSALYAQNTKAMNAPDEDGLMMQGGKMMEIKGNNVAPMQADMVLRNGATVTTTGTVTNKDGKQWMMKEGQRIDMGGNCSGAKGDKRSFKHKSDRMPSDTKTVDQRTMDK